MNHRVITVSDEMTVQELADLFTGEMISGAPVVDADERLVGVVSLSDIVRTGARRAGITADPLRTSYYLFGWEDKVSEEDFDDLRLEVDSETLVRDIMTPTIFGVPETMPIGEMADTMIRGRIHRLIVTRGSHVVGIVTTLDMLKAIRQHTDGSSLSE
jgi:CBS domain-containing protein